MSVNHEQEEFWSSDAGDTWIAQQAAMDGLLAPVLDLVLDAAQLKSGDQVLDVGCGAGTSTALAAQAVGADGSATGVDISQPLLDQARSEYPAETVRWLHADAQTHSFVGRSFDAMISRFGVMFFENTTAAFTNIRNALKPNGKITMAAWAAPADNPWFMTPAQVARATLGAMPKTDRTLPGPFAFEDPARVIAMLQAAGLSEVTCTTHEIALSGVGQARDLADLCCAIGPADSAIRYFNADADQQRILRDAIATAFADYETPGRVRVPASIHLYQARA